MNILIAGGTGFLGRHLESSLQSAGHQLFVLTRRQPRRPNQIQWDGLTANGWGQRINEMDAVVNLCGYGTEHWPWTRQNKKRFEDSRVLPTFALASAIASASSRPRVYVQASGINYYGLSGEPVADESTPPADDFLAQLSVKWEDASQTVEDFGVRRVILRTAVVLARRGGLFPLMALPVRLFVGGRFGHGNQSMPWIHVTDYVNAVRHLLESNQARGPFNLISPEATSNADFMEEIAGVLHRPYWFHFPTILLRMTLGEMSILLTEGRYSRPTHLLDLGFQFQFGNLHSALQNLLV